MNPQHLLTQVQEENSSNGKKDSLHKNGTGKENVTKPNLRLPLQQITSTTNQTLPNRDFINSPREAAVSQTVPWKQDHLLPPMKFPTGKKCLVLDLDETLVHSSFKPVECDFITPIELEGQVFQVYVAKRPYVDEFMKLCGQLYEVVVFTASLATYADAVLDLLDIHKVVDWRLFRESCSPVTGTYVKDLGRMGRPIEDIIIIDNSPHSYAFNPLNAIPVQSWFSDQSDTELLTLVPILERLALPTVRDVKIELQMILDVPAVNYITTTFGNMALYGDDTATTVDDNGTVVDDGTGYGDDTGGYDQGYGDDLGGEAHTPEEESYRRTESGYDEDDGAFDPGADDGGGGGVDAFHGNRCSDEDGWGGCVPVEHVMLRSTSVHGEYAAD